MKRYRVFAATLIGIAGVSFAWVTWHQSRVDAVSAKNRQFMDEVESRFVRDMPMRDVRALLHELGSFNEIYNNCTKAFEAEPSACRDGYGLVTSTRLPHTTVVLGEAYGQMYFTFAPDGSLTDFFYEVGYRNNH